MDSEPRTRITFFLPSLECGGTERNTINLIKTLPRDHYAVSLVLAEKKGDFMKEVPADVPIIDLNARGLLGIFFSIRIYFNQQKADMFVSAFPRFNAVVLLAKQCSSKKTKLIITEHLSFRLLSKNAKTFIHRLIARFLFPSFIALFYPKAEFL